MSSIELNSNYLFVFAHPDDEVYCCVLMHQLIRNGKKLTAVFITSGDTGTNPEARELEVMESMAAIGVGKENIFLLGFPEKIVLANIAKIIESLKDITVKVQPDCIVGMDYEGGHEIHDSASYVASQIALSSSQTQQYVFPVYHAENAHRVAGVFLPNRLATDTIKLSPDDVSVKISVLESHRGQIGHFLHLQRQKPDYFQLLFTREIFRRIIEPIDYAQRPSSEMGYESHRNGFKFADFENAIKLF